MSETSVSAHARYAMSGSWCIPRETLLELG
jgi:hypothetical protein